MSLFSKLFKKHTDSDDSGESIIQKEDFIDESEPEPDNGNYTLATGQGIDLIYDYLKQDFERKGYDDALTNPDISYRDLNKSIIRSNLEIQFKQIRIKYEDQLRLVDFHINSRRDAGLIDIVNQLITHRETLQRHEAKLLEMEKDLYDNKSYMISMLLSYEKGFTKGLAALSLEQLKSL